MTTENSQSARSKPPDLIGDCRLMLRHALKEGLDIPSGLQRDLAVLDRDLARCNVATLTNLSECLLNPSPSTQPPSTKDAPGPAAKIGDPLEPIAAQDDSGTNQQAEAQPSGEPSQLLYRVHAALLRVVAPATVGSLLATESMHGADKMVIRGMPIIVKWAALAAIVCAIGFILTAIPVTEKKSDAKSQIAAGDTNRTDVKTRVQPANSLREGTNNAKQP